MRTPMRRLLGDGGGRTSWRSFAPVVALASIMLLSLAVSISALRGVDRLLHDAAVRTATNWVDTVFARSDMFLAVFHQRAISREEAHYLEHINAVGGVVHYTFFDPNGRRLFGSRQNGTVGRSLEERVGDRARAILAGEIEVTVVRDGKRADKPPVYAVAYVPIIRAERIVTVARVVLDETEELALYSALANRTVLLGALMASVCVVYGVYLLLVVVRRRRDAAQIHHLAHHDRLTGLANRNTFQRALGDALAGLGRTGPGAALVLFDIDRFKSVNDALGHDVGDELLQEVGRTLRDRLPAGAVLARLAGDEFAALLPGTGERRAMRVAERALDAVRTLRQIGPRQVSVSVSAGVALAPRHGSLSEPMLRRAEVALDRAKSCGRDQAVLFEEGMEADEKAKNQLRMHLRSAVETNAFALNYQPLHHAVDGRLVGFEALLRLPDGQGGHIPPGVFLPVAEDLGLSARLGPFVIATACREASRWPHPLSVAVNLSPQEFEGEVWAVVQRALDASGLAPERLELEITEEHLIGDPERVRAELERLKALGVTIVMDDFGTGYSSLSYLWEFPFDKIKVDKSCFRALGRSAKADQALRTIAAMGRNMGLVTTAEGIETHEQREFARGVGYDIIQGFVYARPLPVCDVRAYVAAHAIGQAGTGPLGHANASRPPANAGYLN